MQSSTRPTAMLLLVPALFGLLGLGLLVAAAWMGYQSWGFLQAAKIAPGTVAALEWSADSDSSGARPVVSYEWRGEPYQLTGAVWSSPPAYAVGDQVHVLYPPDQPRAARLYSWFEFWFVPTLLGGIGLVFALVGGGVGYALWRGAS